MSAAWNDLPFDMLFEKKLRNIYVKNVFLKIIRLLTTASISRKIFSNKKLRNMSAIK